MGGIGLVSVTTEEYARAPEFRYLASWVRREAKEVFGAIVELPADEPLGMAPDGAVLILDARTLLTRRSLRRMAEILDETGRAVAPLPLERTPLDRERPIYTLRGFELLEEEFLSTHRSVVAAPAPWSALLLPAEALAAFPSTLPSDLLSGGRFDEGAGDIAALGIESAGLCHRFADYYGQPREDVVDLIAADGILEEAGDGGTPKVLEVGCGRGETGHILQERLGCRVTGVELNPVVAGAAARRLHRVVSGDFQEVAAELAADDPFDALVATELFEHLTDQEGFLNLARRLLRPGGRLVLSVPNVGHYSVVEDLLAGRWDYLPIGLLCYTHFRFFTRRTLEDWLTRCGFPRFRLVPQDTELPDRWRPPSEGLNGLEVDEESLRTKGFYVVATVD